MPDLPPLKYESRANGEGWYAIDELVPGLIEAHSGVQSGAPVVKGTRLPTTSTWVWEYLDRPDEAGGYTREQLIAAYAFQMGVDWQRSRKRRARMWTEVLRASAVSLSRMNKEYEPGDETI